MQRTKNLENPENLIVSIQVSLDGFSFYIKNKEHQCVEAKSIAFARSLSPEKALSEIKKIIEATPNLQQNFEEVVVVYVNELFTVVPQALFDEKHLTDYLKFNTKILKTDFIVYDELETLELVNIYVPYANINNFFFDHFGTFTYFHSQSILLKNTLALASTQTAEVFVHVRPNSLSVIAYQEKKLLLSNQFNFDTPQDFVYYILFCYEQLQLNPEIHPLVLSGAITEEDANYEYIYQYVREVRLVAPETTTPEELKNTILNYPLSL
ncbi:MAG: DUF3822 family protein [Bacteroidota bacterium]|nr:DUF3822 family protein [Bacteroidota bacterium]